jgi:hypothetical protein
VVGGAPNLSHPSELWATKLETNMKYELVELDDRAGQYMVEKIGSYKSLSRAVLARLDLGKGLVYSIWPKNAIRDDIYSFEDGADPGFLDDEEIQQQFADYIGRYLSSGSDKIVILEDSCAERDDRGLVNVESNMLFHGNEVYHFLLSEHNESEIILNHLGEGSNAWRNWVLFSSLPPGTNLVSRGEMDANLLNALAERAEKHAIDAYDLDGFLIWEL